MAFKSQVFFQLLSHLVSKGETKQEDLPKLLGRNKSSISREINLLSKLRLVEKLKEPSPEVRGAPLNIWKASFLGIIFYVINTIGDSPGFPLINPQYMDEWIIFQEWDYIRSNPEVLKYVWQYFVNYHYNRETRFAIEQLRKRKNKRDISSMNYVYLDSNFHKRELARRCLGLWYLFDFDDSFYSMETTNILNKYIPFFLKNVNLANFIANQIEIEKVKCERVEKISSMINEL